ncbi:MAG: pyridoxamine 5'-phosphate oxidase family protein [Pyrinomonadaceae bacterium]|nr:pyridoxamine 5'-phosphate oxidase family protein [Pyrinomonadaceae bacterium]
MNHEELLSKIFAMLTRGTADRKSPLHTPTVATKGADGSPQVRVVVFRKFLTAERSLIFHTDLRSPKITELRADSRVSWLFYDPSEKIQFRIKSEATIHADENDALKLKQWQATRAFGRRCYMGEAPSRIAFEATSGMPAEIENREPTIEESEIGFPNFAVIAAKITSIDCLELYASGHRRSFFAWNQNDELKTDWLTP